MGMMWEEAVMAQFQVLLLLHLMGETEERSKPSVRIMWTKIEPRVFLPPHGTTAPTGPGSPHYRNFTITLTHTTFDGTPLDEWSTQQTDIKLHITQHSQETNIHASSEIWTCNPSKQSATEPWLGPHGDWDQRKTGAYWIPIRSISHLTTTFRVTSA